MTDTTSTGPRARRTHCPQMALACPVPMVVAPTGSRGPSAISARCRYPARTRPSSARSTRAWCYRARPDKGRNLVCWRETTGSFLFIRTDRGFSLVSASSGPPAAHQPEVRRVLADTAGRVDTVLARLGHDPAGYGLVHADLCPENILDHHGRARPIDFDDAS